MSDSHLGGALPGGDGNTIMRDVWGYLMVRFGLTSVIDIGCGFGQAMQFFNEHTVSAVGVDGWEEAVKNNLCPGMVTLHDYTKGPYDPGREFDLAWSAEFLEHVEERYMPNYMATFKRARIAVVTHARIGQHGHHHVNCKEDDYWIEMFWRNGFAYSREHTQLLRATDRWKAPWGRCTLMLFFRL